MTIEQIIDVVKENDFNVTFSGGDPFYQPLDALRELAHQLHALGYTIWAYTGYLHEELLQIPDARLVLQEIDTLVDGPFIMAQRDISLRFRGSANQRIIHHPGDDQ